eukprot:518660-Pyramimonas_sp.AAC.1
MGHTDLLPELEGNVGEAAAVRPEVVSRAVVRHQDLKGVRREAGAWRGHTHTHTHTIRCEHPTR